MNLDPLWSGMLGGLLGVLVGIRIGRALDAHAGSVLTSLRRQVGEARDEAGRLREALAERWRGYR